jgi:phosphoadenosine phosphosulfate reductase
VATPSPLPKGGPELDQLNRRLESLDLTAFLAWSHTTFGAGAGLVTSFGPSGLVILDHLLRLDAGARVITLDTQFLFAETYEQWEAVERRYGIRIEVVRPDVSPAAQEHQYGANLWSTEPDICCDLRKVRPMARAVAGLAAWYTGIRRDQSVGRGHTQLVAWDSRFALFKLSPLAGWTREQVWSYIRRHDLPYNRLHDQGYPSVGCTHCTRPAAGVDERAGRWAGHAKTECGLHWAPPLRGGCAA